jgi:hypothetical protein
MNETNTICINRIMLNLMDLLCIQPLFCEPKIYTNFIWFEVVIIKHTQLIANGIFKWPTILTLWEVEVSYISNTQGLRQHFKLS